MAESPTCCAVSGCATPLPKSRWLWLALGCIWRFSSCFYHPWQAALFIVVHRALAGFHMGSVFAPNHKGMPVLEPGEKLDYLRQQVLTARDVLPNPVIDFAYGGLNYQIEHHLFPNMPRNRLKDAREVVRTFCLERGIPYHETGFWQSQREILGYMHEVSAPLRSKRVGA